jgi:hypothetical protein
MGPIKTTWISEPAAGRYLDPGLRRLDGHPCSVADTLRIMVSQMSGNMQGDNIS